MVINNLIYEFSILKVFQDVVRFVKRDNCTKNLFPSGKGFGKPGDKNFKKFINDNIFAAVKTAKNSITNIQKTCSI